MDFDTWFDGAFPARKFKRGNHWRNPRIEPPRDRQLCVMYGEYPYYEVGQWRAGEGRWRDLYAETVSYVVAEVKLWKPISDPVHEMIYRLGSLSAEKERLLFTPKERTPLDGQFCVCWLDRDIHDDPNDEPLSILGKVGKYYKESNIWKDLDFHEEIDVLFWEPIIEPSAALLQEALINE